MENARISSQAGLSGTTRNVNRSESSVANPSAQPANLPANQSSRPISPPLSVPRSQKMGPRSKIMYFAEDQKSMEVYKCQKITECKKSPVLIINISNQDQIDSLKRNVTVDGEGAIKILDGPLKQILENGGTLIIDYDESAAQAVESFNSLFDKWAYFEDIQNISPDLDIIGLVKTETFCQSKKYSEAFYSRFDDTFQIKKDKQAEEKEIPQIITLNEEQFGTERDNGDHIVDLHKNPNWKSLLLSKFQRDASGKSQIIHGAIAKAAKANQKLIIKNGLWDNVEFGDFINTVLITGQLEINGEIIDCSKLQITRFDGYLDEEIKKGLEKKTIKRTPNNIHSIKHLAINSINFNQLFSLPECREGIISESTGLLGKKSGLPIRITTSLVEHQWHQLLLYPEALEIYVDADIDVPDIYKKFVTEQKKQDNLEEQKGADETLLISLRKVPDIDFELQNIRQKDNQALIYPVTKDSTVSNLFFRYERDKKRIFSVKKSPIWKHLQNKGTLILSNLSASLDLAYNLQTLFGNPPFIVIDGEVKNLTGQIIILEDAKLDHPIINEKHIQTKEIPLENRVETYLNILRKKYEWLKKEQVESVFKLFEHINKLPIPQVQNLYPTNIGQPGYALLDRICKLIGKYPFQQQPKEHNHWESVVKSMILEDYKDSPHIYAYLNTALKKIINPNIADNPTINLTKMYRILENIKYPDQIYVDKYFWQLVDCLSPHFLNNVLKDTDIKAITSEQKEVLINVIKYAAINQGETEYYKNFFGSYNLSKLTLDPNFFEYSRDNRNVDYAWEQQKTRAIKCLNQYPSIFLKGSPGVGKSFITTDICQKLGKNCEVFGPVTARPGISITQKNIKANLTDWAEDKSDNYKVLIIDEANLANSITQKNIEANLTKWAEDKSDNYKVLIIDEANLANKDFWHFLDGVFEASPYIWIGDNKYGLTDNHKIIFTGNQETLPGRTFHRVIQQKFVTLHFEEFTDEFLAKIILDPLLATMFAGTLKEKRNQISQKIIEYLNKVKILLPEYSFSTRDLQEVVYRLKTLHHEQEEIEDGQILNALHQVFSGLLDQKQIQALNTFTHSKWGFTPDTKSIAQEFETLTAELAKSQDFCLTESGERLASFTFEILTARQTKLPLLEEKGSGKRQVGKIGAIIEGPSGRGKDVMLEKVLRAQGFRLGTDAPGDTETFYHINVGPNIDNFLKSIKKAKKEGAIVIISEMNLLPSEILEGYLNDVLAGDDADAHPGFFLFATMNPASFKGREFLSSALLNRLIVNKIEDYTPEELKKIILYLANNKEILTNNVDNIVENYIQLKEKLVAIPGAPVPTSREILKIVTKVKAGKSVEDAEKEVYQRMELFLKSQKVSEKKLSLERGHYLQSLADIIYSDSPKLAVCPSQDTKCPVNGTILNNQIILRDIKAEKEGEDFLPLQAQCFLQAATARFSLAAEYKIEARPLWQKLEQQRIINICQHFFPNLGDMFKNLKLDPLEPEILNWLNKPSDVQTIPEQIKNAKEHNLFAALMGLVTRKTVTKEQLENLHKLNFTDEQKQAIKQAITHFEDAQNFTQIIPQENHNLKIVEAAKKAQKSFQSLKQIYLDLRDPIPIMENDLKPEEQKTEESSAQDNLQILNQDEIECVSDNKNEDVKESPGLQAYSGLLSDTESDDKVIATLKRQHNQYFGKDVYDLDKNGLSIQKPLTFIDRPRQFSQESFKYFDTVTMADSNNRSSLFSKYGEDEFELLVPTGMMPRNIKWAGENIKEIKIILDKNNTYKIKIIVDKNNRFEFDSGGYWYILKSLSYDLYTPNSVKYNNETSAFISKPKFKINYNLAPDLAKIIEKIKINPPKNEEEIQEAISRIETWFKLHITYSKLDKVKELWKEFYNNPGERNIADFLLEHKIGICAECASSFIAILKDIFPDLPVRCASGKMAQSKKISSIAHAWTEVFFSSKGWRIFDATGTKFEPNDPSIQSSMSAFLRSQQNTVEDYIPELEVQQFFSLEEPGSILTQELAKKEIPKNSILEANKKQLAGAVKKACQCLYQTEIKEGSNGFSEIPAGQLNPERAAMGEPAMFTKPALTVQYEPQTLFFTSYPDLIFGNNYCIEYDFWQHMLDAGFKIAFLIKDEHNKTKFITIRFLEELAVNLPKIHFPNETEKKVAQNLMEKQKLKHKILDKKEIKSLLQTISLQYQNLLSNKENFSQESLDIKKAIERLKFNTITFASRITDNYLIELLNNLENSEDITSINLSWCRQITDTGLKTLAEHCPNLTSIHLSQCYKITDTGLEALAEHCPNLTAIGLSQCDQITDTGLEALAVDCPNLTSIDLSQCYQITDTGLKALAEYCKNLTSIGLSQCYQITGTDLEALAVHCRNLTSIHLSQCYKITGTGLEALAVHCPNLTAIDLSQCRQLTDADLKALAEHCKNLTSINLSYCDQITGTGLEALAEYCEKLTSINLSYCYKITDTGLKALVEHCPNLTAINLDNCNKITDTGLKALAEYCEKLTSINLSYCNKITDTGLKALAEHCPNLTSINLSWCRQITDIGLKALAKHCRNLTSIDLSWCRQLTDADLKALAEHYPNLRLMGVRKT